MKDYVLIIYYISFEFLTSQANRKLHNHLLFSFIFFCFPQQNHTLKLCGLYRVI